MLVLVSTTVMLVLVLVTSVLYYSDAGTSVSTTVMLVLVSLLQ